MPVPEPVSGVRVRGRVLVPVSVDLLDGLVLFDATTVFPSRTGARTRAPGPVRSL